AELSSVSRGSGEHLYLRSGLSFAGLALLIGYGSIAKASDLSLSSEVVNPRGTATLSATLTVSGTAPADLEWTFSYSIAQISAISITPGPATSAAVKKPSCASGSGVATCLVTGMNSNVLASGVVAYITATIAPGATVAPIQILNQIGSDPNGNGLSITPASGVLTTTSSLLSSLSSSPTTMSPSGVSTFTVTLGTAAPTGGSSVTLTTNSAWLTVRASVVVAAGGTTATFTATASAYITISQNPTITASLGSSTQ